jgi:hypothetical protein
MSNIIVMILIMFNSSPETFHFFSDFVSYIFLQNTECLRQSASKTKSAFHKKVCSDPTQQ